MLETGRCPGCGVLVRYPNPGETCPTEDCEYELGEWVRKWREGEAAFLGPGEGFEEHA